MHWTNNRMIKYKALIDREDAIFQITYIWLWSEYILYYILRIYKLFTRKITAIALKNDVGNFFTNKYFLLILTC